MKILKNLEWRFDYWIKGYFYGPFNQEAYEEFMFKKWKERYSAAYIKKYEQNQIQ